MKPHALGAATVRLLPGLLALCFGLPGARAQDSAPSVDVTANGRPLELHGFTQGWFGLLEVSGPTDIAIRAPFDIRWVDVRPKSFGIAPQVGSDHRSVRLRLAGPAPVTVEFNDDLGHVLHLFAYAPEINPPKPDAPGVHYFGPGIHRAGLISLQNGETLYLAPGAWVKGCVRSIGTHGVTIRGRGVLDGSELALEADPPAPAAVARGVSADLARLSAERALSYGMGRQNLIYLQETEGALIEGVTLFDSRGWTVCIRAAHNTRIDGLRILNPSEHYGDDGIDLVSSSQVLVENAFVRTNDDCVAVKNLDNRPTHDIAVRHCVLWNMPNGGNGLEIGFETGTESISHVRFADIDLIHVQRGAALSIHNADAAEVADVAYDHIRVEDVRRKLIDFGVLYSQYSFDRPADPQVRARGLDAGGVWDGAEVFAPAEAPARAAFRGRIRNVRITDLSVVAGALPYSVVAGFDGSHPIENVEISGLNYLGTPISTTEAGKFVIEFAPGFRLQ